MSNNVVNKTHCLKSNNTLKTSVLLLHVNHDSNFLGI